MNADIIELKQTAQNKWQARYHGNYGIYTIKITLADKEVVKFSCSCPSDWYPCKHISIIKEAILEQMENDEESAVGVFTIEELLRDVPQKRLYNFLVREAKLNYDLVKSILIEFSQPKTADGNKYAEIVRKGLNKADKDRNYDDDYYYGETWDIEVLDALFDKAEIYLEEQDYHEVGLICKACIEETAAWLENTDNERSEYFASDYQLKPFELLKSVVPKISSSEKEDIFDYCYSKVVKKKYQKRDMFDGFNDLLLYLAAVEKIKPDSFIELQDKFLKGTTDFHSKEKILRRKIQLYREMKDVKTVLQLLSENLQFSSFCKELVEHEIEHKHYSEAKKLIYDFLGGEQVGRYVMWDKFLLEIAQNENDINAIRTIAFRFIKNSFDKEYFLIYKSTFKSEDWTCELENLIDHYEKQKKGFNDCLADLLSFEKEGERLMLYIKEYLSPDVIEKYYHVFADDLPIEALMLFRQSVDSYINNKVGRGHYEYAVNLMKEMLKIKGGKDVVRDMIDTYKLRYKTRKLMVEMLNEIRL